MHPVLEESKEKTEVRIKNGESIVTPSNFGYAQIYPVSPKKIDFIENIQLVKPPSFIDFSQGGNSQVTNSTQFVSPISTPSCLTVTSEISHQNSISDIPNCFTSQASPQISDKPFLSSQNPSLPSPVQNTYSNHAESHFLHSQSPQISNISSPSFISDRSHSINTNTYSSQCFITDNFYSSQENLSFDTPNITQMASEDSFFTGRLKENAVKIEEAKLNPFVSGNLFFGNRTDKVHTNMPEPGVKFGYSCPSTETSHNPDTMDEDMNDVAQPYSFLTVNKENNPNVSINPFHNDKPFLIPKLSSTTPKSIFGSKASNLNSKTTKPQISFTSQIKTNQNLFQSISTNATNPIKLAQKPQASSSSRTVTNPLFKK